jgi:hypothetical protein
VPTELPQGHHYHRIARPLAENPKGLAESPVSGATELELANSRGQLVAFMEQLQRICQTIHPRKKNFKCYGHKIRYLLILASTEVEAQWRAVLLANGMTARYKYKSLRSPSRTIATTRVRNLAALLSLA